VRIRPTGARRADEGPTPEERARQVRLVIFDVDGVLTDGSLFLGDDGQEYKAFNSRDGHGMTMLRQTGVVLSVITGRSSEVVRIRMESLGVAHVYQGRRDKLPAYEELKATLGLADEAIAYVGDDVVDLPVMRRVGLAIAVADAHPLVHRHAHWQTPSRGGRGAGRDVCELIMEAQGTLSDMMSHYL
jgi:3-deoxy-D-manno-octulosonate 8-phosphate phosphatase (KDO 8-P phosphatase)